MKTTLLWVLGAAGVVVVLVVIGIGVYVLNGQKQAAPAQQTQLPVSNTTGSGTTTNPPMTVAAQNGGAIQTNDFISNGTTVQDQQNPGNYYLAGDVGYCLDNGTCPSGAPANDYKVMYVSQDRSFIVALVAEPLGQARKHAEQFMMNTLGLTETQMCALNYYLGTTVSTNATYAGRNLGFSFCPGAVPLP